MSFLGVQICDFEEQTQILGDRPQLEARKLELSTANNKSKY